MSEVHRDDPISPLRLCSGNSNLHDEYASQLDVRGIFRALIADEVRQGRLSPFRRRRIVHFAAHLGLSAVEVGSLIAECRSDEQDIRVPNHEGEGILQISKSAAFGPVEEEFDEAYEEIRRSQRLIGAIVTLITGTLIVGWWLFRA